MNHSPLSAWFPSIFSRFQLKITLIWTDFRVHFEAIRVLLSRIIRSESKRVKRIPIAALEWAPTTLTISSIPSSQCSSSSGNKWNYLFSSSPFHPPRLHPLLASVASFCLQALHSIFCFIASTSPPLFQHSFIRSVNRPIPSELGS